MYNTAPTMYATAPTSTRTPAPPTVHERAIITWGAIFPLVTLSQWALSPLIGSWPPVLRALAITLVVVPIAVYVVVPRMSKAYLRLARRR
jgi:antibiotic biosynthesis monooxygenase (ABM) superfamily enzyme